MNVKSNSEELDFLFDGGVVNVCHPERSEAESKDLNAMVGVMAAKTDEDNALEILYFVQDDNGIGGQAKFFLTIFILIIDKHSKICYS